LGGGEVFTVKEDVGSVERGECIDITVVVSVIPESCKTTDLIVASAWFV
jgi:hypothetical protein